MELTSSRTEKIALLAIVLELVVPIVILSVGGSLWWSVALLYGIGMASPFISITLGFIYSSRWRRRYPFLMVSLLFLMQILAVNSTGSAVIYAPGVGFTLFQLLLVLPYIRSTPERRWVIYFAAAVISFLMSFFAAIAVTSFVQNVYS